MKEPYIQGMVQALKPVLTDPAKARAILERYWRTRMALVWDVKDVYRAGNEREVALSQREAVQVLHTLHSQHNPQYGIRWEDLTTHIEDQVLGRQLTQREVDRFVRRDRLTINH